MLEVCIHMRMHRSANAGYIRVLWEYLVMGVNNSTMRMDKLFRYSTVTDSTTKTKSSNTQKQHLQLREGSTLRFLTHMSTIPTRKPSSSTQTALSGRTAQHSTDRQHTSSPLRSETTTKEPTDKGTLYTCKIPRVIKSTVKKQDLFRSEKSPNFIARDAIQVKSRLSDETKTRCRQSVFTATIISTTIVRNFAAARPTPIYQLICHCSSHLCLLYLCLLMHPPRPLQRPLQPDTTFGAPRRSTGDSKLTDVVSKGVKAGQLKLYFVVCSDLSDTSVPYPVWVQLKGINQLEVNALRDRHHNK
ncbi:hypothetical protein J6590_029632 [Homalodisca vitripennis]|nr:hypothetical protein J6590_029632 [Homalodisca vitripennis]